MLNKVYFLFDDIRKSLKRISIFVYIKSLKRKEGKSELVRPSGLEPPTPTMSRWCSNQLSYGRTKNVVDQLNGALC